MAAANVPIDDLLIGKVKLVMSGVAGLTGFGAGNAYRETIIPFQFPPLVKSDNKGGNWKEFDIRNAEPLSYYMGATPRQIDLNWTYIVTNQTQGGVVWDISTIATYVKEIRGYFYNMAGAALIIKFQAYDVVGPAGSEWTFRAEAVNITHSDTTIYDNGKSYHLKTDIAMKLKFFVDMSTPIGKGGSAPSEEEKKMLVKGLSAIPTTLEWL